MSLGVKTWLTAALIVSGVSSRSMADSEAYVEIRKDEVLRELTVGKDGAKLLVPALTAIEGSILALDIVHLNKVIELQKLNPSEVNYQYKDPRGQLLMSSGGVFCGIRIVDIPDDEIRESEAMDNEYLCLPLKSLKENALAMDGNLPEIQSAVKDIQISGNNLMLAELSIGIEEKIAQNLLNQESDVELVAKGSGFVKPLDGPLVAGSGFGMRMHPVYHKRQMHKGLDLAASSGSVVKSALPGRVLALKSERNRKNKRLKGYGYYVIVVHPDKNMETLYAHLSSYKTNAGNTVAAGERIAASGATGIGTGPHLHFETHVGKRAVDPKAYIGRLLSKLEVFFEKYFKLT